MTQGHTANWQFLCLIQVGLILKPSTRPSTYLLISHLSIIYPRNLCSLPLSSLPPSSFYDSLACRLSSLISLLPLSFSFLFTQQSDTTEVTFK